MHFYDFGNVHSKKMFVQDLIWGTKVMRHTYVALYDVSVFMLTRVAKLMNFL